MNILLATNNKHKIQEIKSILSINNIKLFTLSDLALEIEVEEDKDTLEGNSVKKALDIFRVAKIPTVADDTGLFVPAINNEPGVFSSRYAGESASYDDNCRKLLTRMNEIDDNNRNAYFKTVVCFLIEENKHYLFEGIMKGRIIREQRGMNGFGYDPLFVPEGFDKTYAEMTEDEKNSISHRGKAFIEFRKFIMKQL
jgi:XTP/dITP diphosphohydrolase